VVDDESGESTDEDDVTVRDREQVRDRETGMSLTDRSRQLVPETR